MGVPPRYRHLDAGDGGEAGKLRAESPRRRYPRTSHSIAKPNTALRSPTRRKPWSGVCVIAMTARLAASGKAAKTSPSMTNTKASAARKSVIGCFGGTQCPLPTIHRARRQVNGGFRLRRVDATPRRSAEERKSYPTLRTGQSREETYGAFGGAFGFGPSLGISLPVGLAKYRKKSESGRSTSRVSFAFSPAS